MIQFERFERILVKLQSTPTVKVSDLSEELSVSESTIRRDIIELDKMGKLHKVFGGAASVEPKATAALYDMASKAIMHVEEKRKIAQYAASLIQDQDFVFIDAGTTTGAMIEFLENRQATYVTNGARHALNLAAKGLTTYVIAGQMKAFTEAIVGPGAVHEMRKYHFTKSFIGVDAIDSEQGLTTSDIEESMVKKQAISRSEQAFVLADHSKFNTISSVTFAALDETVIVTDRAVDNIYVKKASVKEV